MEFSAIRLVTPFGWQHAVLIAPNRVLTYYISGTENLSLGHDSFILAERSFAWVDGAQVALDPRACMVGNAKAGFCVIALAHPAPANNVLPLPTVDPWPVSFGEKLSVYVHTHAHSGSLFARTRAALIGGEAACSLGAVAGACEGAIMRFRSAATIPPHSRGAPVLNERGEWVGLMCARAPPILQQHARCTALRMFDSPHPVTFASAALPRFCAG